MDMFHRSVISIIIVIQDTHLVEQLISHQTTSLREDIDPQIINRTLILIIRIPALDNDFLHSSDKDIQ